MATNAGDQLREARELKGLTVEDVAARLRIPARYVRALEQGDSGVLPEPTFVRGYVKSYARELGLDADALVAELAPSVEVKAPRPLLAVDGGTSGRKGSAARSPNFRAGSSRRRSWLVAVVVVVVLVLVVVFVALRGPATPSSPVAVEVPVAPATPAGDSAPVALPPPAAGSGNAVVTAIRLPPAPSSLPAPAAAGAAATAPVTLPVTGGAQSLSLPPPAMPAPAATPAPTGSASPAVKEDTVPRRGLYIRFRGESWVEVRDVDNVVLHTSVQSAGSVLSLEGKAPLTVTLGDSSAADLWYNGTRQQNRGGSARVNRIIVGQAAR